MANLSIALDEARAILNDVAATRWTDTVLLPFAKKAHREMQLDLLNNGLPIVKSVAALQTITAGGLTMTLPADLVEPIEMHERKAGSSDTFVPMVERLWEPDEKQGSDLRYWLWRQEAIAFLGATENREVRLRYWRGITVPTSGTSPIGVIFGEAYVGPKTAALAGMTVGNDTIKQVWEADAATILDKIVRFNVRGQQGVPVRRRAYRPRRLW